MLIEILDNLPMIVAFVAAIIVGYYTYYSGASTSLFFLGLFIRLVILTIRYGLLAVLSGGESVSTPLCISIILMLVFLVVFIKVRSLGRIRFIRSDHSSGKNSYLEMSFGYLILVIIGFVLGILGGVLSISPYLKMCRAIRTCDSDQAENYLRKTIKMVFTGIAICLATLVTLLLVIKMPPSGYYTLALLNVECVIMILLLTAAIFTEYYAYSLNRVSWIIFFAGLGAQIAVLVFKYIQYIKEENVNEIRPLLSVSSILAIVGLVVFLLVRVKGRDRYYRKLYQSETDQTKEESD